MAQSSPQHASLNNGGRHRSISLRSRRRSILHFQVIRSKVTLHPAAPASHKPKNQRAAKGRAGQRNQSPHPPFSIFRAKVRNPQAVLVRKLTPKVFRVNLDGPQSSENSESQKAPEGASRQRCLDRIV